MSTDPTGLTWEKDGMLHGKFLSDRFHAFIRHTIEAIRMIPHSQGFNEACDSISACRGRIVFSGLGKAGIAATKSAATFNSMGIPSIYLHPAEASHGDSGVICPEDILMAFSTSGKTREILETIELARKLKVSKVISVTSHPDATVRQCSDIVVDMGVVKEAGHLSIAPTTSILVMLTLADMMATIVSEAKGFTMDGYSTRHHAGYLGEVARGEINAR